MAGLAPPFGIQFVSFCSKHLCGTVRVNKEFWYKLHILVLTYVTYTAFHLSRKPLSIVKNVLVQNCPAEVPPPGVIVTNDTKDYWCNWPPFNVPDADQLLGTLDSAFLFSYAIAMFFSGMIAERMNLRYFLSIGMLLSGLFTYLFGLAHSNNIHLLWYFILVQVCGGIVQTSGWPSVVACIGNWFGKGRRGLIFGIWNSHTSVGNILGALIAGAYVTNNWGWSFMIPGAIIGIAGFVVFLFLVVYPEDVGCSAPDHHGDKRRQFTVSRKKVRNSEDEADESWSSSLLEEERPILGNDLVNPDELKAIGFVGALKIPGVVEYSLCLFFAKLVSYTFLYWLPRYINISTSFSAEEAANLSTLFDVGGIVGGIIAGVISDHTGASATTCMVMLATGIPTLFLYEKYGSSNLATNIVLLMVCGLQVNGPYALITTAVSAELGTHHSLKGNSKALATVASIIDGTGSLGAAVGPLLAGNISVGSWDNVFVMLMVSGGLAMLFLTRLVKNEFLRFMHNRLQKKGSMA